MFERLSNSFELAKSSWEVLRTDKKLVVFPMISGLGCLLVLISFALPFIAVPEIRNAIDVNNGGQQPPWIYAVAFAFYFCNYFVIVFCNSALISCALIRFSGGEPTLADGFSAAASRLPQIIGWALVAATVGLILKLIENVHERAGQFISAILGTAWTVITFFVVPVLVVEKVGPFEAINRSMSILRQTWGEALVGRFGLGLFKLLLLIPAVLVGVLGVVLLAGPTWPVGAALLALAGIYFLVWMAVGSALDGIFIGALYQYAVSGSVPRGFDAHSLRGAFARK